jgi:alkanesulfonate monooxygenase SsuD/methylene tetrahydromethanopterin reductase-like flavin-dependent oxidoreductase (luciferase family)
VLAKAVSTLDVLTGGRVRLSVGVGHAEREFEILGVPFHERGRVADEHLAAMVELWTSASPEFHGRYVDFADVAFEPKPVQRPHPPIWIGGNSEAAMRRAARHDGWYPWLITVDDLPRCRAYLDALPEMDGRARPFDICMPVSPPAVDEEHQPLGPRDRPTAPRFEAEPLIDAIGALADAGVTWTSIPVPPARSLEEHLDGLRWLAAEVLPSCR